MSQPPWRSLLVLEALFVLTWNSGFIGAEYGLPYAGAFTLLLWRYLLLTGLIATVLALRGRLLWPGTPAAGLAALVGVLAHGGWLGCVLLALQLGAPAGMIALVTALQPLLTGAFSGPVVGEPTGARQWAGLVLGFLGVVIAVGARLAGEEEVPTVAYLLPFLSVLAITTASLIQRRMDRFESVHRLPVDLAMFYQSGATAIAMVLPAVMVEGLATTWTGTFMATMAWLVVVVSLGSYGLMWVLIARRDATRVASLFYLSPPVTMVMAWLAFGDTVTPTDILGLAVAATGVALVHGGSRP
ncbi:MAG: DMT family transporter [Gammaproteobacteria bacterium]|nr:DMT family transporter [Gammaproteobacteria bacterium]